MRAQPLLESSRLWGPLALQLWSQQGNEAQEAGPRATQKSIQNRGETSGD